MHNVLESWNEYYSNPSTPLSSLYKSEYRSNKTAHAGSQHVFRCFFAKCTATQGGGILVESETKLLIEETSFFSCEATSGMGGGVYFDTNGSCIFSRVCSYMCKANSSGQFCYVKLPELLEHNNTMKDCSISGIDNPSKMVGICMKDGKILVSSINSSYNSCDVFSGVGLESCSSTPSDCLVSYSCFTHNSMKRYSSVKFQGDNKHEMRRCNVINNTQELSGYGAISAPFYLDIYDSCIINNNATYSIYQYGNGEVNVYNTVLDQSFNWIFSTQCTAITTFINSLSFIKTGECDSENYTTTKRRVISSFTIFDLFSLILGLC